MSDLEKRSLNDKFMLRLPDGMRDRIKAASDVHNRSMNAEIVHALETYFRLDGISPTVGDGPMYEDRDIDRIQHDSDAIMQGIRAARRLLYRLETLEEVASKYTAPKD